MTSRNSSKITSPSHFPHRGITMLDGRLMCTPRWTWKRPSLRTLRKVPPQFGRGQLGAGVVNTSYPFGVSLRISSRMRSSTRLRRSGPSESTSNKILTGFVRTSFMSLKSKQVVSSVTDM